MNFADDPGDEPDTFDGRLAGIARLIDTFGFETVPARRELRRAVIERMLAEVQVDADRRIAALLARLDEVLP